jgi:peptide/nickel transport system substrate-binding protein
MGVARRRARGVSRREFLQRGLIGIGIISLGAACAPAPPAAPAAQPTSAPPAAQPTTATKPAADAKPAAQATSAPPAAQPTTAAAVAKPKSSITIVLESEPDTILPKDATTDNAMFVMANVYSALTYRQFDQLGQPPKIVPHLAESFDQSQSDPKTWRFKLRKGVKFHNGEPFNADAVVTTINAALDQSKPGLGLDAWGLTGGGVAKVDDYTVDIATKAPDAILPNRLAILGIAAPGWLTSSPKDGPVETAVGAGPYKLVEYGRASHFLLQADENYWGPTKPTIGEIKLVFRNEANVRSSMLRAGEAQLATLVTPEDAKQLPATFIEQTGESVGIKINPEHPLLKDLRVRQAINMSIDRDTMISSLYGDVAEHLNGMMVRKSSLGWNPNLKEYPFDLDKAKQLMKDAGGVGQSIELISRNNVVPRVGEVNELVADQISQTGLKVTIKSLEIGQWRIANQSVKPGDTRPDLLLTSVSDPVLDWSRALIYYFSCGGVDSEFCDQAFTDKLTTTLGLTGDARVKGFQELWQTVHDQNLFISLFGLNFVHGLTSKLHWNKPRQYADPARVRRGSVQYSLKNSSAYST